MCSEIHVVANIRGWSFIVEMLQTKQTDSCGIIIDAYLFYNMIWGHQAGT
jgi:hypothetical protein